MIPTTEAIHSQVKAICSIDTTFECEDILPLQQALMSVRSPVWSLFAHPNPVRRILIISRRGSAAAFICAKFYSEVHLVVEKASDQALLQQIYVGFEENIKVDTWEKVEELLETETYAVIVTENTLAPFGLNRFENICKYFGEYNQGNSEILVVSKNPTGLGVLKERIVSLLKGNVLCGGGHGLGSSVIRSLLNRLGAETIVDFKMYPNSFSPREILGDWGSVPIDRHSFFASFLDKIGVMKKLHNAYFFIGSRGSFEGSSYLGEILNRISLNWGGGEIPKVNWFRCLHTGSVILDLTNKNSESAMLKIQLNQGARQSVMAHRKTIDQFIKGNSWATKLVPSSIDAGEYLGIHYALEEKMQGVPGRELIRLPNAALKMEIEVAQFLKSIANSDYKLVFLDEKNYECFAGSLCKTVSNQYPKHSYAIDEITKKIHEVLNNRWVPMGFSHGDFHAQNVLFSDVTMEITGVIDWDSSNESSPPLRDFLHFIVSIYRYRDMGSYGSVVASILNGSLLSGAEEKLIQTFANDILLDTDMIGPMLVICWLLYLSDTATFNPDQVNRDWQVENIAKPASEILSCWC